MSPGLNKRDKMWWSSWFFGLARYFASASKDPSSQVGCVVVGPDNEIRASGFNGFPRGVADDDRLHDRAKKYPIIVHAEENAVAMAARVGVSIKDCVAYVTMPPCCRCARSLIQAGIREVVVPEQDVPERWREEVETAQELLWEAGVTYSTVKI